MDRSRHGTASHTVVTVHQIFQEALRSGLCVAELRALTGLDPDALTDFSQRLPAEQLFAVWETVMSRVDDPGFPVRAARNAVRDARSAVYFRAAASTDVREATIWSVGNVSAWTTAYTMRTTPWPGGLSVVLDGLDAHRLGARCEAEFQVADFLAGILCSIDATFTAPRVAFAHPAPRETGTHRGYFGPGLVFGAPHTEIVLPDEVLNRPSPMAQPGLASVLDRHLAELRAAHHPPASYRLRVREWLLRQFLSGVTFREVCEDTRRQLAVDLVRTSPRAFKEIASSIGFADSRSFHRAYLRWTGTTPGRDRFTTPG